MCQRNYWQQPFGMHLLDPQVYLQALRGTAQGLAGSLYWAQSTGNYINISEGEWTNIRPWISSAQLARYGQQFHLVFRPFSSLQ